MKTLKAIQDMVNENKELRARIAKLEKELEEFYRIRELMNSINNNIDEDIIPFEDTIDTVELNLKDDDIPFDNIPFDEDVEVVEFDAPIPTDDDIEIPDFTEFLPQEEETKEEETFKINPNDEGIDEELLQWAIEQAGIKTEEEPKEEKISADTEEPEEEVKTEDTEEEVKTAPEILKEIVQSKRTIEIIDRRKKDFNNPDDIAKYISNVLDSYIPTKTEFGEDNPLLKDIKNVYSFISKALKRDSLKYIKDTLGIEEGFKVSTQYRLSVMNALKDIKYILEYQDEPLSTKQGGLEPDDNEDKLLQLEEDTEQKTEEKAPKVQNSIKNKIIDFYDREFIKDTKERDLKIYQEMTEESLKDRFVIDINFQINALKQGWNIRHFKSAKDLDLDSVIPALIGDELLTKMDLDIELLKLLN